MFPFGKHPMYPHTEEDRKLVLKTLGVTESQLKIGAEVIKQWMEKQPHLAEAGIEVRCAEIYLLMAKGSVERTKQRIENYYRMRSTAPEIHDRIKSLQGTVWKDHVAAPVPKLFNGIRLTYFKVFDWDSYRLEETVINLAMIADIRFMNDFPAGEIWKIDLKDATLGQIVKLNFVSLSRGYWILREGCGVRISAIHVVNCSMATMAQAIVNLCRPFLSKKILGRLKIHESSDALHEFIPNEYLLKDYGGDLPSYEVYREKMEEFFHTEMTKQYLLQACKLVSDESKRPPESKYDADCLQGNFKKLELD